MTIILRSILRSLVRKRALTLVQLAGVACGVMAVIGMLLASRTSLDSFHGAVRFLQGRSSHSLARPVGSMEESVLTAIISDDGVESFAPVLDRRLGLLNGSSVRVLGVDPFLDREVRPDLLPGAPSRTDRDRENFSDFFMASDTVLLEARLARELGIDAGGSIVTDGGTFRVLDTFAHPSAEPLIVMDIAQAQERFEARGEIDRVDLILKDPEGFASRWTQMGFRVSAQEDRQGIFEDMLKAFRLNLQALSLLALLVGVFLVYNTSMFSVVSRRKDAGVLRSLGATRREIVLALMVEIGVLGVVGGFLGGVLGFLLANILTEIVGGTISRLYFFLSPLPPQWSWSFPFAGALLGFFASLLGGFFPLFQLARQDPVAALRGRAPEVSQEIYARWTAAAGVLLTGISVLVLLRSTSIITGYLGTFGVILGLSFMCGLLLVVMAPLWRAVLRFVAGPVGTLAAGNVRRNLGRTAVAVAAFGIALSLSVGLGSMIGSFRKSLIWWMEGQIRADYYLEPTTGGRIPLSLYDDLSRLEGVGGVDPFLNVTVPYEGTIVRVTSIDPEVVDRFLQFFWVEGGDETWERLGDGQVVVSESFSRRFGLRKGERATLSGVKGPVPLEIAGVFYDYTTEHGVVMMSRGLFIDLFNDDTIGTLAVFLEPEGDRTAGVARKVRAMATEAGLTIYERQGFRDRILSIFDATFSITHSMRALAILVAFLGITGALLTLFMERRKEFGIYRALGLTGKEVALMTLLEGLGMGLSGFALSAVAGTAITFILIKVINLQSFNWTIFFFFDAVPYLAAAGIALFASLGAAVYPMLRIVRSYPKLQIREE